MGGGASSAQGIAAGVNTAILNTSQEDLAAALAGLDGEDRGRLLRALQAAEAEQPPAQELPKLTYFDVGGRAIALRVALFKAFGKDGWVDQRIDFSEWEAVKPTTPLGSLPILTLPGGEVVAQTEAMMRWAGKHGGLYPDDPREALLCDFITSTCIEMLSKCPKADDKEGRDAYAAGFLTAACTMLEGKLGDGFIVGGGLTLADLMLYGTTALVLTGDWTHILPSFLDPFPKLLQHNERVKAHKLVVAYYEQYPN